MSCKEGFEYYCTGASGYARPHVHSSFMVSLGMADWLGILGSNELMERTQNGLGLYDGTVAIE